MVLVAGVMTLAISLERERIARIQFADRERHEVTHLHAKYQNIRQTGPAYKTVRVAI